MTKKSWLCQQHEWIEWITESSDNLDTFWIEFVREMRWCQMFAFMLRQHIHVSCVLLCRWCLFMQRSFCTLHSVRDERFVEKPKRLLLYFFFFLQWCADLTWNIWTDLVNSFHFLTAQNKKESHTLNSHTSFVLVYIYCVCDAGSLKMQVQRQRLKKTQSMCNIVCHKSKFAWRKKVLHC